MRKFIIGLVCLLFTSYAYGIEVSYSQKNISLSNAANYNQKLFVNDIKSGSMGYQNGLKRGLTFYKDFASQTINADYFLGQGLATFTNNSSNIPIYNSNGISLGTARDDVLTYLIAGNRTAAQETIIIKFTPDTDFANDGVQRHLTDTDVKSRMLRKFATGTSVSFYPNANDEILLLATGATNILANISYVVSGVCKHGTPFAENYLNGASDGTDNDPEYTNPGWGTNFYIGSNKSGALQLIGSIAKVAVFNRALSASEVSNASSLIGN